MKDQILELRAEGKTYLEIQAILGCSKSTISYHCGKDQKTKNSDRQKNRRKETVICQRVERFRCDRKIRDKSDDFQRGTRKEPRRLKELKQSVAFKWQDVIAKYGWETTCYLTGRKINLREPRMYHFDHKIPYSKGGHCDMNNLGIACKEANTAKNDMEISEFFQLCKEVLEFNGYKVEKRQTDRPSSN